MQNILKNKKGVTLVELIVSISIFTLIMLSALGILKIVLEDQRNSISSQNIQEGIRYALEMMAKEIRSAQPSSIDCRPVGTNNRILNTANSDTELHFVNKEGVCVIYMLEDERLKIVRGGSEGFLTSAKIRVNSLRFSVSDNIIGTPPGSRLQPRVTISIDLDTRIGRTAAGNRMQVQTTVSSRFYE